MNPMAADLAERGDQESTPRIAGAPGAAPEVGFRELMSLFPTGVAVVTTMAADGEPQGMTCTSLCSVSVDPPTLAVCLRIGSVTLATMHRCGAFALNLLSSTAAAAARRFAEPGPGAFARTPWSRSPSGQPILVDSTVAWADCSVAHSVDVGDHSIVIGVVDNAAGAARPQAGPLLYGLRRYAAWDRHENGVEERS